MPANATEKSIERLSLYRRLLIELHQQGRQHLFSHELAEFSGRNSAQVRRDIMATGYVGTPSKGYNIAELLASISAVLDTPGGQRAALVGVGNLGRALLSYFSGRRPRLKIIAAFDNNPGRTDRVINGCHCYPVEALEEVVRREQITVGILTLPPGAAQKTAMRLYEAGVRGILNFAPVPLSVPPDLFVETMDVTTALEKVAYYTQNRKE